MTPYHPFHRRFETVEDLSFDNGAVLVRLRLEWRLAADKFWKGGELCVTLVGAEILTAPLGTQNAKVSNAHD